MLIYFIKNECFYNVLIQVFFVGRSIHYIRISATFKVSKEQGAKVTFQLPPLLKCPIFYALSNVP